MKTFYPVSVTNGNKTILVNIYEVESREVANEIVNFCNNMAMLAIQLDSPQSKIFATLDIQAAKMGGGVEVRKALYNAFNKCVEFYLHPEWF